MSDQTTTQRIEELSTLGANWDSYGALKANPDVLKNAAAMTWLNGLPRPDIVVPLGDGETVRLSWEPVQGEVCLLIRVNDYEVGVCYDATIKSASEAESLTRNGLRTIGVMP